MTLRDKLKWHGDLLKGDLAAHRRTVEKTQAEIASGKAQECTYFWFVTDTVRYAVETYLDENKEASSKAARLVADSALLFFYGAWRNQLKTPDGKTGHEAWQSVCLWYDQVHRSFPFPAALSDWEAVTRIAQYPPEHKLSAVHKATGETAWSWAIINFLRGEPREKVEAFLKKAEGLEKAKRPKLLCPVLRALMDNDAAAFEKTLLAYLAYYRKSEFKRDPLKLLALEGTTLYHLGRKQGFNVTLPEKVADHVIRLD
jgi:hypothetical protein